MRRLCLFAVHYFLEEAEAVLEAAAEDATLDAVLEEAVFAALFAAAEEAELGAV